MANAIPSERPPTGEFGEALYEDESSWWEEGGGDVGMEQPDFAWTDPSGEVGPGGTTRNIVGQYGMTPGGLRPLSPRQRAGESPFAAEVAGFRPTPSRPRPGSFHLQSIERELEQQARIKGLREAGRPERGKPPPAKPFEYTEHSRILHARARKETKRRETLAGLQFQIEEMELQKQMEFADLNRQLTEARLQKAIRQAKEIKKIPKRRKPRPVWGI